MEIDISHLKPINTKEKVDQIIHLLKVKEATIYEWSQIQIKITCEIKKLKTQLYFIEQFNKLLESKNIAPSDLSNVSAKSKNKKRFIDDGNSKPKNKRKRFVDLVDPNREVISNAELDTSLDFSAKSKYNEFRYKKPWKSEKSLKQFQKDLIISRVVNHNMSLNDIQDHYKYDIDDLANRLSNYFPEFTINTYISEKHIKYIAEELYLVILRYEKDHPKATYKSKKPNDKNYFKLISTPMK